MTRGLGDDWLCSPPPPPGLATPDASDRPPEAFRPREGPADAHAVLLKLRSELTEAMHGPGDCCAGGGWEPGETPFSRGPGTGAGA